MASDEKARQMLQNQLKGLKADIEQNQQYLQVMDEKYPKGYPTADEIRKQRENLSTTGEKNSALKELELEEATGNLLRERMSGSLMKKQQYLILIYVIRIVKNLELFRQS